MYLFVRLTFQALLPTRLRSLLTHRCVLLYVSERHCEISWGKGIVYHGCDRHRTWYDVFLIAAHMLHFSICALSYPPTLRIGTVFCDRGPGLRLV